MRDLFGNTQGLKANQIKRIQKLAQRRVRPWQLVSPELARSICELSVDIGRQIGLLIDRRGRVEWTIVGNDQRMYLPDIGRLRGAKTHFRGLRLVHAHLRGEALSRDDLSDLSLLRLDYVVAVLAGADGLPGRVHTAHLLPGETGESPWRLEDFASPHSLDFDFIETITELEAEFARKVERAGEVGDETERAMLVDVAREATKGEDNLAEMQELARTAGIAVVGTSLQIRPKVDPHYLIGKGKIEEVVLESLQKGVDLIVFGRDLAPAQARAIADVTELRVIDRTQLILDIFAKRAMSADGKLQVELAQLKYRMPRLTREDGGLSRLVGGIGGIGPGETKLEINRRRARDRVTRLEREIDKLSRRRGVRRAQRQRNRLPIVALVGYTNAGKSTLLNQLTNSKVFVEDKLFATLDPTSRRLRFPRDRQVILIDTVGFLRDLPADLAKAFRATTEELAHADLLLHVVDVADRHMNDKREAVLKTLEQLNLLNIPRLLVLNKADRLKGQNGKAIARRTMGILTSATKREGFKELLRETENILWQKGAAAKNAIFSDDTY
ncbi:MAG: GTPase HflX [Deltaproteobacteria bacterium]|nr:GTPase HflX [Deltaproteobacteria bacterium]